MKEACSVLPESVIRYMDECRGKPHPESHLVSVLQKTQEACGFLSREVMEEVSQRMQVPAARVTGVATFYHFFRFQPQGRHQISVCKGTACFVRGADKILRQLSEILKIKEGETTADGEFSLVCARCIGACAMAPVLVVDERVYGNVQVEDVAGILKEHGYTDLKQRKDGRP